MPPAREKSARDLLDFYLEAGVDALVGEAPVDRFAPETAAPPARAPQPVSLPRPRNQRPRQPARRTNRAR